MNIFIDSNIWLGLYHFSSDDLSEFSKLKDTTGSHIYITKQTIDEVKRNRIVKINDARDRFEKFKWDSGIPNLYKEFKDETKNYNKLKNDIELLRREWKNKVSVAINERTLEADEVIDDLFEKSTHIETDTYYDKAIIRMNIGNPPGKNNSYGDAINWEALIDCVPNNEDLYIITEDQDFYDDKNTEIVNSFLHAEWKNKKNSNLFAYRTLGNFFTKHLTTINLREEQQKDEIITELECSTSFRTTHIVIEKLTEYLGTFTENQLDRIIEAFNNNSQIYSILSDEDVDEFHNAIIISKPKRN